MLRQFVMWSVFAIALFFAFMAKAARWGEFGWYFLGLAAIFSALFLYVASTPGPSGERWRPFRLISLWMKAKERDLQARIDGKS